MPWLIKSEPTSYSYEQLVKDKSTAWTGVRNFTARNNLRGMKKGDECLFYHSNEGKSVVGIARVVREGYPNPTQEEGEDWTAVDVAPVRALARPVTLDEMKADKRLVKMVIFKQSRLSVVPVTAEELEVVAALGKKKA